MKKTFNIVICPNCSRLQLMQRDEVFKCRFCHNRSSDYTIWYTSEDAWQVGEEMRRLQAKGISNENGLSATKSKDVEDRILDIIRNSSYAVSLDEIQAEILEEYYSNRQKISRVLDEFVEEGIVREKVYTINYSRTPRIDVVVAEVYYVEEDQRRSYETNILPELMKEMR